MEEKIIILEKNMINLIPEKYENNLFTKNNVYLFN